MRQPDTQHKPRSIEDLLLHLASAYGNDHGVKNFDGAKDAQWLSHYLTTQPPGVMLWNKIGAIE